jgi:hypothetical protein
MKPETSKGGIYTAHRGAHEQLKKYNRPKYSLEFKQDAANLVLEKGYSQQKEADHGYIAKRFLNVATHRLAAYTTLSGAGGVPNDGPSFT